MQNHLHRGVLLIDENRMVCAVVKKYAEPLRIKVILIGDLHGEVGAEELGAGDQYQEEEAGFQKTLQVYPPKALQE